MERKKTYFNWSSGKDASLALYRLKQDPDVYIDRLPTSINAHHDRVSMHGLRRELLNRQAESIGLPLETIELPEAPSMEDYNQIMEQAVKRLKSQAYTHCGFGDIFLEDLRKYREEQLEPHQISCIFPLWKSDTKALLHEFISLGFKAVVICIKAELLDESFLGREIDERFIADLPANVDPCGENGEFHTFCYDGPIFNHPIAFQTGEKTYKEYKNPEGKAGMGFWFQELIPID